MSFTTVAPAIAQYAIRCEEHLRDLPPETFDQLRRDIVEIVGEVCAELDGPPEELVGPPLRFVTELRAAAGLSPPPAAASPPAGARRRRPGLRDGARSVWEHAATRWVRHLVPELRPAWWVARGFLVAALLGRVTGAGQRPSWLFGVVPYWPVLGSGLLGIAAVAAGVFVSVEAGRRVLPRRARALRLVASVAALWFGFVLVAEAKQLSYPHDHSPGYVGYPPQAPPREIVGVHGVGLVEIGSDVEGVQTSAVDLRTARSLVDRLLTTSPPAAIFIDHRGTRTYPGTRAAIDATLQGLADQGFLNQ